VPAWLVEDESDVQAIWLEGVRDVGVTAGASTPEYLVRRVCERLAEFGAGSVRELPGLAETIRFRLPEGLRQTA
jgi:4-hydroxy-3-methylbut-2-enyl diphosphate reductase